MAETVTQERCSQCQRTLLPKAKFCRHCGVRLAAAMPERPRPAPPRMAPDGRLICNRCSSPNRPDSAHCRICGTSMRPQSDIKPGELVDARGVRIGTLAGFWVRAAAYVVDTLILAIVSLPAYFVLERGLKTARITEIQYANAGQLVIPALAVLYMVIGWSAFSTTLGKRAFKLYVVRADGSPPSAARALLRQLATVFSLLTLGFGYLMVGIRPDKRALHDLMAETYVVIKE